MDKPDPINPALRQRLEDRKRLREPPKRAHESPPPISEQTNVPAPIFWIGYFAFFLFVVPLLFDWL